MTQEQTNIWESIFADNQMMWGTEPTVSAVFAKDYFLRKGIHNVLVPGVGYGRNAKLFVDNGMSVTGIEISGTAIALSRSQMGLDIPIHHGSVTDMPFDAREYDGIFCYGLIYLLDADGRAKLTRDCWAQLAPGGTMLFTVISKQAPMYGQGPRLGDDWYEIHPGMKMYFYDVDSVQREFGGYGLVEHFNLDEPLHNGGSFPFINVLCRKP
jgi:SAM-dependent methyltransferase